MKILYIIGEFPSVSQTFILNQLTGLIDRGHELTILAPYPEGDQKKHKDVDLYNLIEKTIYYKSPIEYKQRVGFAVKYVLKYALRYPNKIFAGMNFLKYGKQALTLKYILAEIPFLENRMEFDVIHCHFGDNGLIGEYLKSQKLIEGKIYTTFHGYDMTTLINKRGKKVFKRLFTNENKQLPISGFWKEKLLDLGCSEETIIVHPMGVDVNKFEFVPQLVEKEQKVRIVSTARLVEKKGIEYAVKAVAKLVRAGFDIEYNIIGDGPLFDTISKLIYQCNMEDTIYLKGWKTQDETIKMLKQAHIFLAPSVTSKDGDMEGIPVAIMEAMAMGKIVVSTYHSGIPELIEDGKDGYLVQERDIDNLYSKLKLILSNKNTSLEITKNAREKIISYYNIERLNGNLEVMFNKF